MATPSPYNFDQRKPKIPSLKFASAEDYAKHHAALKSGQLGHNGTYITGANRGKTPDQAYAYELEQGAAEGYPLRNPENAARRSLGLPGRDAGIDEGMTRTASNTNTGMSGAAPTGSGSPGAIQTPPAAATPAQPNQSAVSAPQLEAQVRAQGFEMQNAGITQRGTDGSVLYNNGASISPTSPTGGRVLTSPYGSGSVTMGPAKTKSFDGMSPAQFGAAAAARQGVGNRFASTPPRLGQPAVAAPSAPGPAQQRLADFTASNPPTLTDQQINQKQQTFQANRDKLTAIQAQKGYAAERAKNGPQEILADPTPQTQDQKDANAAVGYTIKSTIPGSKVGPNFLGGKPYKSPLIADMSAPAPAPKPAGTPLSQVPPHSPVVSIPSTRLQPSLLPSGGSTSIPPLIAGRRAAGGPVQGGQPYLVGEQGPEIMVPDQSGTVVPNHQIPSLRQPLQSPQPRKPLRPTASVVPIKPPSLLATFG